MSEFDLALYAPVFATRKFRRLIIFHRVLPWGMVASFALTVVLFPPFYSLVWHTSPPLWGWAASAAISGAIWAWFGLILWRMTDVPVLSLKVNSDGFSLRTADGRSYTRAWGSPDLNLRITGRRPGFVPPPDLPSVGGFIFEWGLPLTFVTPEALEGFLAAAKAAGTVITEEPQADGVTSTRIRGRPKPG